MILIEAGAEDLEIKSHELIHKMKRNHPKPMKLWFEFPKKYGETLITLRFQEYRFLY